MNKKHDTKVIHILYILCALTLLLLILEELFKRHII